MATRITCPTEIAALDAMLAEGPVLVDETTKFWQLATRQLEGEGVTATAEPVDAMFFRDKMVCVFKMADGSWCSTKEPRVLVTELLSAELSQRLFNKGRNQCAMVYAVTGNLAKPYKNMKSVIGTKGTGGAKVVLAPAMAVLCHVLNNEDAKAFDHFYAEIKATVEDFHLKRTRGTPANKASSAYLRASLAVELVEVIKTNFVMKEILLNRAVRAKAELEGKRVSDAETSAQGAKRPRRD